jgi:hypothetical protein
MNEEKHNLCNDFLFATIKIWDVEQRWKTITFNLYIGVNVGRVPLSLHVEDRLI